MCLVYIDAFLLAKLGFCRLRLNKRKLRHGPFTAKKWEHEKQIMELYLYQPFITPHLM